MEKEVSGAEKENQNQAYVYNKTEIDAIIRRYTETESASEQETESAAEPVSESKDTLFSRNWSWWLAAGIAAVFMLVLMMVAKVAPFGENSFTLIDSMHQYVPFFSDYQQKLKEGGSLFYTWNIGGGLNFQSLLLYYMACPLNVLVRFVSREHIIGVMSMLITFKIVFSTGAFGYYLSRRGRALEGGRPENSPLITAFSLAFGLNAYMCGYYWNLMWLDCIMVFPLIMLGFERLMVRKDPRMYVTALFYSLYCNYYISFMICIFLVLWFFASGHGGKAKRFLTDGLRFAGCSLLAAGMACLSLLMAYLAIMKTAAAGTALPEWSWYGNIFDILKQHLFLTKPITNDNFDGRANLYCGTLTVLLFFLYLTSDRIRLAEKIRKVCLVAFLAVSMNAPLLNFIWHGFHDQYGIPNRFSFLYIFTLLLMGYEALSRIRHSSLYFAAAGFVLAAGFYVLTAMKTDFASDYGKNTVLLWTAVLFVLYTVLILIRIRVRKSRTVTAVLLSVLMTAEILVNAGIGIGGNGFADGSYYLQYTDQMEDAVNAADLYAKSGGYGLQRGDEINPLMLDENTYNGMKSLGTFCSTVRGDMVTAMAELGFYTGANEYLYDGATSVTNTILGTRFIFTRTGDYYPSRDDYEKIYDRNDVQIYENKDALPIAYGVNRNLENWTDPDYNSAGVLNLFGEQAAETGLLYQEWHVPYGTAGQGCTAGISASDSDVLTFSNAASGEMTVFVTFTAPADGRFYINVRGSWMNSLTYKLNGTRMASDRYMLQMFDLGNLHQGDLVELDLKFSADHPAEGSESLYLSSLNSYAYDALTETLHQNAMKVSSFTDSSLKGTVNLEEGQVLFTSIPYDEGWQLYDNGKKVKTEKLCGAFLGADLGSGTHELEFRFVPQGFYPGLVVSIVSLGLFAAIWILWKKKDKESRNPET